ncbi:unnamed protein product [Linum trigynum]|uniref:Uncharacterized protein n=1 Tax=Linum trigynum TaxID=586398 RepID=A0AAV2DCA6_9ROSI
MADCQQPCAPVVRSTSEVPVQRRKLELAEEEEDVDRPQPLPMHSTERRATQRRVLRGTHNIPAMEKGKGKQSDAPLPVCGE